MNRVNFKEMHRGVLHHLSPYRKAKTTVTQKSSNNDIKKEPVDINLARNAILDGYDIWLHNNNGAFGYRAMVGDQIQDKPEVVEKKVVSENEITVVNNPTDYGHKNGFYTYHEHKVFKLGQCSLSVSDSIGGCGMQQLYGWTNIHNTTTAFKLLEFYLKNRHHGVGLIICQLGQTYFNGYFEEALIKHGFEIMSEYKNLMHGADGSYKQRVYSLKTS